MYSYHIDNGEWSRFGALEESPSFNKMAVKLFNLLLRNIYKREQKLIEIYKFPTTYLSLIVPFFSYFRIILWMKIELSQLVRRNIFPNIHEAEYATILTKEWINFIKTHGSQMWCHVMCKQRLYYHSNETNS